MSLLWTWTARVKAEPLPCLDSNAECIEQLSQAAIANSAELKTLAVQVELLDDRDELIGDRISYTRSRQWTNFLTLDPIKFVQTIFGGGDYQRSAIAISDLEIKKAGLGVKPTYVQNRTRCKVL